MFTSSTEVSTDVFQYFQSQAATMHQSLTVTPQGNVVVSKKNFDPDTGAAIADTIISDVPIQSIIDDLADSKLRVILLEGLRAQLGL